MRNNNPASNIFNFNPTDSQPTFAAARYYFYNIVEIKFDFENGITRIIIFRFFFLQISTFQAPLVICAQPYHVCVYHELKREIGLRN